MKNFFSKLTGGGNSYTEDFPEEFEEDYVELTTETDVPKAKIVVRPFVIEDFVGPFITIKARRSFF